MDKITVLVADDHPLLRDGIVQRLQKQADFEVVAQAADGEEAVRLVNELSPDVVVIDIEMPKVDGLEATKQIKANHPEASVLVLTVHDDEEYVAALLDAGAAGYLLKTAGGEELAQAIRAVRLGEFVLDPQIGRRVLRSFALRPSKPIEKYHEYKCYNQMYVLTSPFYADKEGWKFPEEDWEEVKEIVKAMLSGKKTTGDCFVAGY